MAKVLRQNLIIPKSLVIPGTGLAVNNVYDEGGDRVLTSLLLSYRAVVNDVKDRSRWPMW